MVSKVGKNYPENLELRRIWSQSSHLTAAADYCPLVMIAG